MEDFSDDFIRGKHFTVAQEGFKKTYHLSGLINTIHPKDALLLALI